MFSDDSNASTARANLGKLYLADVQIDFLGSGTIDPFDTLPPAVSKNTGALVDHCE